MVKYLLHLTTLTLILKTASCSWFFEEAQKCDPSREGILPFSGFRIYRVFKYEGYVPSQLHYLSLVHCDHGEVDYETISVMPASDIQWERPFCMIKPTLSKSLLLSSNGMLLSESGNDKSTDGESTNKGTDGESTKKGADGKSSNKSLDGKSNDKRVDGKSTENANSASTIDKRADLASVKDFVKQKVEAKLESITNGKFIQYTSSKLVQLEKDIQNSNWKDVLLRESRNLVCYKMARKKKYARKDFDFYIPDTFVGGLYECPISEEDRRRIIKNMEIGDVLQPLDKHFKCDPSTARPIVPLLADASINQWIETKFNPFNPSFKQLIPYMTTPSPLDLRFALTSTPDMHADSWASQLEVNEDYDYSTRDLHYASVAVAATANFINKLLIIDLNKAPLDLSSTSDTTMTDAKKTSLLSRITKFDFNQKLISLLGLVKYDKIQLAHIQKLWELISD